MKKTNMNIFRTLAITLLLMVGSVAAYAQLAVQGTVIDAANGEPIIGASVLEIGTTNGTITDFDGFSTKSLSWVMVSLRKTMLPVL